MSDLHPTTAALLAALRRRYAPDRDGKAEGPDMPEISAWMQADSPDAPEPRFVPTEPGWYWRRDPKWSDMLEPVEVYELSGRLRFRSRNVDDPVADDGLWLGPVAPWSEAPAKPGAPALPPAAERLRAIGRDFDIPVRIEWMDGLRTFHAALLAEVKDGAFLCGKYGSGPTPDDAAADYLRQIDGKTLVVGAYSADRREITLRLAAAHPGPCPPKPRTAEEARKEPMPGDRWATDGATYDVVGPSPQTGWIRVKWSTGAPGAYLPAEIGEPGETYLGHFPVDP